MLLMLCEDNKLPWWLALRLVARVIIPNDLKKAWMSVMKHDSGKLQTSLLKISEIL
jgi:hypothetical protein